MSCVGRLNLHNSVWIKSINNERKTLTLHVINLKEIHTTRKIEILHIFFKIDLIFKVTIKIKQINKVINKVIFGQIINITKETGNRHLREIVLG